MLYTSWFLFNSMSCTNYFDKLGIYYDANSSYFSKLADYIHCLILLTVYTYVFLNCLLFIVLYIIYVFLMLYVDNIVTSTYVS